MILNMVIKNKNIIKKPPVTSPYIIVIGNARPRKNLETLIKATHLINQEQNTIKLIIIGKADKKMKIIEQKYKNQFIQFTGFISDNQKFRLLAHAKALIFPSLYEGFGIPILEAQSLNIPVICSAIPAFKEIGGESVLFFDAFSHKDLKNKIKILLNNTTISDALKIKGAQNIKRFNWKNSSKKLSEIIHQYENPPNK